MMYRSLAVILIFISSHAHAEGLSIGGDENLDACASLARIKAKNFVLLRSNPSVDGVEIAKLKGNQDVFVCTESNGWYGVVVPGDTSRACGVSTPWPKVKKYKGPCKSGWIETRQVEIVAG